MRQASKFQTGETSLHIADSWDKPPHQEQVKQSSQLWTCETRLLLRSGETSLPIAVPSADRWDEPSYCGQVRQAQYSIQHAALHARKNPWPICKFPHLDFAGWTFWDADVILGNKMNSLESIYSIASFINTRRYGPLRGPTYRSCGELWPLVKAFLPFGPKKGILCCYGLF